MKIIRTLVVAGVVAAIAAPAAQARPADIHAPLAHANAQGEKKQDLRSPDARDAAGHRKALPGPPTWPVNPKPIAAAPAADSASGSGVDWAPITIGIAAGLALLSGAFVLTSRRRLHGPRMPA